MDDAKKWDRIYSRPGPVATSACRVLRDHSHLLPPHGTGLDLACGRAANALLLAEHGLNVSAWDVSATVIDTVSKITAENDKITAEIRDVSAFPPPRDSFDVIVVSRFLERPLIPSLKQALRRNGLIFYQTFSASKIGPGGPDNPDYLLRDNELLRLFNDFRVLIYRDEGRTGDINRGFRNEALLVAQKPE